ncbi:fumarylacetoacetate hydrolase family protein [Georgenia yuyongxinii]|uniref:Fumarylacetoacetate hydrolase family protein n=1 Tax=Georgenia yuyongxinii TaxID=2589797 RepID=A0A5B8CBQ5_9MICO|nr:fumarylacetoacetate hydrolase family protein [Georgenia yuyongxinii]
MGGGARSDGAAPAPDGTRTLSPLLTPSSVLAIGLNYADHCREFGTTPPDTPVIFTKAPQSVLGDGDAITWSTDITDAVDWEAELGVVIGRRTRNVSVAEALDAVFGYTVVNDVTARDIQKAEAQWVRAKSLDTFCPMGPVIVPAREIPDPQALAIRSRLNGQVMQDSSTAEMIFPVAELISYLSASLTLVPGDVIATGTPLGVGAFRTPPVFLRDGDTIEVEIERIGTLTNTCRTLAAVPTTSTTKEQA